MDTFECKSDTKTIFKDGCLISFGNFIKAHAVSLGAAGLVIALFQVSTYDKIKYIYFYLLF